MTAPTLEKLSSTEEAPSTLVCFKASQKVNSSPISFDDDGKERKDLIQISHGKYHYMEIIFINLFQNWSKSKFLKNKC